MVEQVVNAPHFVVDMGQIDTKEVHPFAQLIEATSALGFVQHCLTHTSQLGVCGSQHIVACHDFLLAFHKF
jgi:hypothetical protein